MEQVTCECVFAVLFVPGFFDNFNQNQFFEERSEPFVPLMIAVQKGIGINF